METQTGCLDCHYLPYLKILFYQSPRSTYCRSILYLSRATISRLLLLPIRYSQDCYFCQIDTLEGLVLWYTMEGWPSSVNPELQLYCRRQNELTIAAGCLIWGIRVAVQERYQKSVLEELHTSHPGIVRTKSFARVHVWWPSIDNQIKEIVRSCSACREVDHLLSPYTPGRGLHDRGSASTWTLPDHVWAASFSWLMPTRSGS